MRFFLAFLLLAARHLTAVEPYSGDGYKSPWLTGPLLAPLGEVVKLGSFTVNTCIFANVNTGRYNGHWHYFSGSNFYNVNPALFMTFGLTDWLDIQINPQMQWNSTKNQSSAHFGDLPIGFDCELLNRCAYSGIPGIKFSVVETFPTGKYQNLAPHKYGTDKGGFGTYATEIGIVFYQLCQLRNRHFLSNFLSFSYTINTPVHVKGFNAYGGGYGTDGKVYPGNVFNALFSFEYTFNQHWVFAMDNLYIHCQKTRFSGEVGTIIANRNNVINHSATMSAPSSDQISFAPALEYNFNEDFGIIGGIWFSLWGRNTTAFISGVVEIDYSY